LEKFRRTDIYGVQNLSMNEKPDFAKIPVFARKNARTEDAERIADEIDGMVVFDAEEAETVEIGLLFDETGLSLVGGGQRMQGDFSKLIRRLKKDNLNGEIVVKAAKIKGNATGLTVLDATAGMGEDSLLLAAAGFTVDLYEYDPIIAVLIEDTLCRASVVPELTEIVGRMRLHKADSIDAMRNLTVSPDVILLDPMFPERQKSALVKKKFQLIHRLEKPCADEDELLNAAIYAHPQKIIIKRPAKAPCLAGKKPSYTLNGKSIRYDCIVLSK